jgi:hypothetical protein
MVAIYLNDPTWGASWVSATLALGGTALSAIGLKSIANIVG